MSALTGVSLCLAASAATVDLKRNPLSFPTYVQEVEAVYSSRDAAEAATCAIAPLPGGAEVAFSTRWDDSNPAHLAKGEMLNRAGVKGNFYLTASSNVNVREFSGKLMAMGHAVGNHTVRHPNMMTLAPNAAFWNIARNRMDLEIATQHTITSYVSPFGWKQSPLDPDQARTVAACLVADGHFVSEDGGSSWSGLPSTVWMWTNRFSANDRNPQRDQFVRGFDSSYAHARKNRDVPRVTLGTHSWCDDAGNARQESWLKEFFHPEGSVQLNDWQYGAYRYQFLYGEVKKVSSSDAHAVFSVRRFPAAYVGDDIALSLTVSPAPEKVLLRGVPLERGPRGTWTLPQDALRAPMPRIAAAGEALRVVPDEKKGVLELSFANETSEPMTEVFLAAALPPKWSKRRVTAFCAELKPGAVFRQTLPMGEVSRTDYAYGVACYPVSVDCLSAGKPVRWWKMVETAKVEVPESAPSRAARVWGPGPEDRLAGVNWEKASVAGAELPDAANWKAPTCAKGDGLWTTVTFPIRFSRGKEGRQLGELLRSGRHARYVVYDFTAEADGECTLRLSAQADYRSPHVWLNGVGTPFTGDGQRLAVRRGKNRLIVRADAKPGQNATDTLYLAVEQ